MFQALVLTSPQANTKREYEGARSVAVSYKPPMLVTRVRLPACANFVPEGGRVHDCGPIRRLAEIDPGRTRTCNLWFRRPTPYPLGHRAVHLHSQLSV